MTIEETPRAPEPAKPVAIRWQRNGDHPDDGVGKDRTDPLAGETYKGIEGAVIRFFRRPDRPGDERHDGPDGCWKPWDAHGWIDEGAGGITVCPGDLVIDRPDGTHEVVKLGRSAHRDRNDHYMPANLYLDGRAQYAEVSEPRRLDEQYAVRMLAEADGLMGCLLLLLDGDSRVNPDTIPMARDWRKRHTDPHNWAMPRPARLARVAMASPDELNPGADWWWADMSYEPHADGEPHWAHFMGHRVQVDVELHTANGREVNDWKGRDEIRAGGHWSILCNRQPIWDGYVGSDVLRTLDEIRRRVRWLIEDGGPLDHTDPRPYAQQLQGRRVYYRDRPAVVSSTVLDQGCVILSPVGAAAFPRSAYDLDSEPDGTGHDEQDLYDECEARTVKVHIDDPAIVWHRRRPFGPGESDERYRPPAPEGEIEGEGPAPGPVTP